MTLKLDGETLVEIIYVLRHRLAKSSRARTCNVLQGTLRGRAPATEYLRNGRDKAETLRRTACGSIPVGALPSLLLQSSMERGARRSLTEVR